MKTWEELSDDALEVMAMLGQCGPTNKVENRQVKGCDEDGCSFYLDADNLRDYARGCAEVAQWLEQRAKEAA